MQMGGTLGKRIDQAEVKRKKANEALQASEQAYRSLLENQTDLVGRFTPGGTCVFVNDAFCHFYDKTKDELIGKKWHPLSLDDDLPLVQERLQTLSPTNPTVLVENRLLSGKGDIHWIQFVNSGLFDLDGNLKETQSVGRDITERKQAEEVLKKTQRLLTETEKIGKVGGWEFNIDTEKMTWTEAVYNIHEKDPTGDLTVKTGVNFYTPASTPIIERAVQRAINYGEPFDVKLEIVTAKGNLRNVHAIGKADLENRRVYGFFQDITERKTVEQELTRLRLYLKNMFDSMPSVLVGVDKEGLVTQWNQETEKLTGLSADDAIGQPLDKVLPQLQSDMEEIKTAISRKESQLTQKVFREMDGETHYSDIMVYPLISNGVEGAVVRVDDVTERVRIEQMMMQTEKMMSVGGLAAGMAHEINNPLGVIMQAIQNTIRRVSPDLEANLTIAGECGTDLEVIRGYLEKRGIFRYFEGMREAGSRAAKIVANMLNFSRFSESKLTPTEINALMDSVLELADSDYNLLKKYDFRHIKIIRDYGTDLARVPCTATEIEQVFLNLIRNAAEAMSEVEEIEGGPRVTIRTRKEKDHCLIEIEDNGPGMEEGTRKRVFEPFFTTKPVGVGTGLGLSVSYFIITNNHNGTMLLESEPGNGTKFIIRLPLETKRS